MNLERAILIAFLGNYLINNVVAAIASFVPVDQAATTVTLQYVVFVALVAITVAILARWYGVHDVKSGILLGLVGFLTAIATAFVTGVSGVLIQTASFQSLMGVLPNFLPFLASWSTIILAAYWLIPAALMGWWMTPKVRPTQSPM